jgi:hypothetical protein
MSTSGSTIGTRPLAWQIAAYLARVLAFSLMASWEGVAPMVSYNEWKRERENESNQKSELKVKLKYKP